MIKLSPYAAHGVEAYKPLLAMLESIMISPSELAEHWRVSQSRLSSLRHTKQGLPFFKPLSGAVRYRLSDVIACEIQNSHGPITLEGVCFAIAACEDVSLEARATVQNHLRRAFSDQGAGDAKSQE